MREKMIKSYIDSLRASFGTVKLPVAEEELLALYAKKDYASMVGHIKNILRLDMKIRLGLVNRGGPVAPAWIETPTTMPVYGTHAFRQLVITMYLRKSFLAADCFEAVVCAIAHELCHVVLNATGHPLRRQEEAVDLTAMLLGFRDFYVTGCRSVRDVSSLEDLHAGHKVIETRTQSYMTQEEIGYAATYMTFR